MNTNCDCSYRLKLLCTGQPFHYENLIIITIILNIGVVIDCNSDLIIYMCILPYKI